ncbi:MAG TPA: FeoB small GTPase domain-containing protein, partial [bacterium]|nr:FeoB small GTPase domain-containing protein [bacterium]
MGKTTNTPTIYEKIILIGNANVGKSVIFNLLTGSYAIVSNYPGTTVEISQGTAKIGNKRFTVIDTPGIIDLFGRTEDQQVTRDILLENPDAVFVHIVDAKNLRRGLFLNILLCELGLKQVMVLNMMDEANDSGVFIDHKKISEILGIPVVPMIATERIGLAPLKDAIFKAAPSKILFTYCEDIENIISEIEKALPETILKKRGVALFLAGATDRLDDICKKIPGLNRPLVKQILEKLQSSLSQPITFLITTQHIKQAEKIVEDVVRKTKKTGGKIQDFIGELTIQPITGISIAITVLILLYLIVGKFGAGILVGLIEEKIFGKF